MNLENKMEEVITQAELDQAFGVKTEAPNKTEPKTEPKKQAVFRNSFCKTVIQEKGKTPREEDTPENQIFGAVLVTPEEVENRKKQQEENNDVQAKQQKFEIARQNALIEFHRTKVRALNGSTEMLSLNELQMVSDLAPFRTVSFDSWWSLQLDRETSEIKRQKEANQQEK